MKGIHIARLLEADLEIAGEVVRQDRLFARGKGQLAGADVGAGGLARERLDAPLRARLEFQRRQRLLIEGQVVEVQNPVLLVPAAGDLDEIRRAVLSNTNLPLGNVPLYQAFCETARKHNDPSKLDPEFLFDLIEKQLADGLSFMAIHCGINRYTIERLRKQGFRYGGLVSKGGTFMVAWMDKTGKENPLYEQFDRVCALMKKYDAVLSLGNGIRAGAIHDSHDRAQMAEMIINCELAEEGRKMGCQMMVEGPGHVPLDEIEGNIMLEKRMSGNAPYYVLGPIPLDTGAGYDHIAAAIGAANSTRYGADLICYITPAEHLALPNEDDVREGVRATRLAVRIGDIAKYPDRREK